MKMTVNHKIICLLLLLITLPQPALCAGIKQAVIDGDIEKIKEAISQGEDPNSIVSRVGYTALEFSIVKKNLPMVKTLIENGAQIDKKGNAKSSDFNGFTPLYLAIKRSSSDISNFLIDHGAKINIQDNEGMTPLHLAAGDGQKMVVQKLLSSGANPNTESSSGKTAMDLAELQEKNWRALASVKNEQFRKAPDKAKLYAEICSILKNYNVNNNDIESTRAISKPLLQEVHNTAMEKQSRYVLAVVENRIMNSKYNSDVYSPVRATTMKALAFGRKASGAYAIMLLTGPKIIVSSVEAGITKTPAAALGSLAKDITKEILLEGLRYFLEHPEKVMKKIAKDAYAVGMRAYTYNYETYIAVREKGYKLSYTDAISFLRNERLIELLGPATTLINDVNSKKYDLSQYAIGPNYGQIDKKSLLQRIANLGKKPIGITVESALFWDEYNAIKKEAMQGIENYEPYIKYVNSANEIELYYSALEDSFYTNKEFVDPRNN